MKSGIFYSVAFGISLSACSQTPSEHARAAVAEYVQQGMSNTGNYRAEEFYMQPFTRRDSIDYVVKMNQRNEAMAAVRAVADKNQPPTADFTRRAQEHQQLIAQKADTTRVGLFVRHIYRSEEPNGTIRRDSVDAVVYPPRNVVVLFIGQVPLQPGSRAMAK